MSALSLPAASVIAFDARPVLERAPLRPGFDRNQLSRVGDMRWDLWPALFRTNAQRTCCSVDFAAVEEPSVIPTLKAFLYVRLNHEATGLRRPCPPVGLRVLFAYTRRFLVFVVRELGAWYPSAGRRGSGARGSCSGAGGGCDRLPVPGQQLVEAMHGMLGEARQHVGEPG